MASRRPPFAEEEWSNAFKTRTSAQIQKGVNAFGEEYTAGQLGPRGPQPGFGKPMPAKNPAFNQMLFEFLGIVGNAKQRQAAQKDELVSRGSLINMRKGPNFMSEYNRRLFGGYT
jgi:hypothetical protein